jgi:hypothetical protein
LINANTIPANWSEQKAKLKLKFAALTDNDFFFTEDKKEEMLRKIQLKLNISREELRAILATF